MDKETNFLMLHNKDVFTCLHAIVYLLQVSKKSLNYKQITALLYLADKLHLIRYGMRTVTGTDYKFSNEGLFNPTLKSILFLDISDDIIVKYIQDSLEIVDLVYSYKEGYCNFEMLSESDKRTLEFISKNFSNQGDIYNYVLGYPEVKKCKSFIDKHTTKIKDIKVKDMFSIIDNKLEATEIDVKLSEEFYLNS